MLFAISSMWPTVLASIGVLLLVVLVLVLLHTWALLLLLRKPWTPAVPALAPALAPAPPPPAPPPPAPPPPRKVRVSCETSVSVFGIAVFGIVLLHHVFTHASNVVGFAVASRLCFHKVPTAASADND